MGFILNMHQQQQQQKEAYDTSSGLATTVAQALTGVAAIETVGAAMTVGDKEAAASALETARNNFNDVVSDLGRLLEQYEGMMDVDTLMRIQFDTRNILFDEALGEILLQLEQARNRTSALLILWPVFEERLQVGDIEGLATALGTTGRSLMEGLAQLLMDVMDLSSRTYSAWTRARRMDSNERLP